MQMMIEHELRPCRVTTREKIPHGSRINVQEGLFHCWTSEQWIYNPVMRGEVGGRMQSSYGIVELKTGEVKLFSPHQIQFLDDKATEHVFSEAHPEIRRAVTVLRNELLKHGTLYKGFHSSILSVLKPKEKYIGDGCFEIQLLDSDASMLAEEILKRIIGEE